MARRKTYEAPVRQAICLGIRRSLGGQAWTQHGTAYSGRGRSDIFALAHSVFFGIEVKAPTGKLTSIQAKRIADIRHAGGCAFVARAVNHTLVAMRYRIETGRDPYMAESNELDDLDRLVQEMSSDGTVLAEEEEEIVLVSDPDELPPENGIALAAAAGSRAAELLAGAHELLERVSEDLPPGVATDNVTAIRLGQQLISEKIDKIQEQLVIVTELLETLTAAPAPTPRRSRASK